MSAPSRDHPRSLSLGVGLLAACGWTVLVYLPAFTIPFVGDDYPVIGVLARDMAWNRILRPIPGLYHYLPVAVAYWKTIDHVLGFEPVRWHVMATALLAASTLLVGCFLSGLGLTRRDAVAGAFLFGSFFAGYETVAWACQSYLLWALIFYLGAVLSYLGYQAKPRLVPYLAFSLLSAVAVLAYDACVLILPTVVLLEYRAGGAGGVALRWRRYLVPAALVVGYLSLGGVQAAGHLPALSSPLDPPKRFLVGFAYLACLNQPWLLEAYFAAFWGRALATVCVLAGGLALLSWASRGTKVLFLWVLLHQVPYLLFHGHQARYFLFSAVGAAGLWAVGVVPALARLQLSLRWNAPGGLIRFAHAALVATMVLGGVAHIRSRLDAWREAGRVVDSFREVIRRELVPSRPGRDVVIVDFPERYGALDDVAFPPALFVSVFNFDAIFRLTGSGALPGSLRLVAEDRLDPRVTFVATEHVRMDELATSAGALVVRWNREAHRIEVWAPSVPPRHESAATRGSRGSPDPGRP